MDKPVFKNNSFSVDDIHRLREYHYEMTKNLSKEERIREINEKADRVKREMRERKAKKKVII